MNHHRVVPVRISYDEDEVGVPQAAWALMEVEETCRGHILTLHVRHDDQGADISFNRLLPLDHPMIRQMTTVEVAAGDCNDVVFAFCHHGEYYQAVSNFHQLNGLVRAKFDFDLNPEAEEEARHDAATLFQ